MATMAMPLSFTQVEESVEYVSLAVRIAHRRNAVRAWFCKLHLTLNLHEIVTLQDDVIKELNDGCVRRLAPEKLLDLAAKIDELVQVCETGLATAKQEDFPTWHFYLQRISDQVEQLDSLAETFRESASDEYTAYVDGLVKSASGNETQKAESWRDFVASLHD